MTIEDLLKSFETPFGKSKAKELAGVICNAGSLGDLLHITFYYKPAIAFRAAWVLENAVLSYTDCITPYWTEFLEIYPLQKNQSCRRHYTKIMMHLQQNRHELNGLNLEDVAEATFEWLIDPKSPVAVKTNCLDILLDLRRQYPWITDELKMQTEFLMMTGTAAIQARGKKILQKLIGGC